MLIYTFTLPVWVTDYCCCIRVYGELLSEMDGCTLNTAEDGNEASTIALLNAKELCEQYRTILACNLNKTCMYDLYDMQEHNKNALLLS